MLQLVKSPNEGLLVPAIDWDFGVDTGTESVEKDMLELLIAARGIGLAAQQVGLTKRVFAIKLKNGNMLAMFNPKSKSTSAKEHSADEGCLSFPDLWLNVNRPISVEAEYFDKCGNQCTMTLEGIDARCFLHELDHLNGVVFTSKVTPMQLLLAQKENLTKRNRNGRTKR